MLEYYQYTPIIIILGNVFPPINGIRIHWIFNGVVFLTGIVLLIKYHKYIYLIFFFLYAISQIIFSQYFSIFEFINFIAGPTVFFAVINISLSKGESCRYFKIFIFLLWIPVTIAVLQFFSVLPLTFLNAQYVNIGILGDKEVARVNGFLYHGIELVVISVFLSFFLFNSKHINKSKKVITCFVLFCVFYIYAIKSGIVFILIYSIYHLFGEKLKYVKQKKLLSFLVFFAILFLIFIAYEFKSFFSIEELSFSKGLLTGRGQIWTIYLAGFLSLPFSNFIFGAGFGANEIVFTKFSSILHWYRPGYYPHAHNQILEIMIFGGIFYMLLLLFLFKELIKKICNQPSKNEIYIFLLLLFGTVGMTHPIMDMFIFWACFSFLYILIGTSFE